MPTTVPTTLTFPPVRPTIKVPPTKIADDTYVIHQVQPALGEPLFVYLNSMVILGKEPVIVDTGTPANRTSGWKTCSRSSSRRTCAGSSSRTTTSTTPATSTRRSRCARTRARVQLGDVERHTNCFDFPLERCRWVTHGESFEAGDRTLQALRPPVYDSPTTRGLYDPKSKVLWAVDTFATPLPDPGMGVADLDPEFWSFGLMLFALGAVSPWLTMADPVKYGKHVDQTQDLDITTIASCHSPVIEGPHMAKAFARIRELADPHRPTCPTSRSWTRSSPPRPKRGSRPRSGIRGQDPILEGHPMRTSTEGE